MARGRGLSGMTVVPGTLGMKHMVNSDISAMGKGEQIAESGAPEASKTRLRPPAPLGQR